MIITEDLYDVARRIKEIAPYYFVVYNEQKGTYELHSDLERPTYVLTFPFSKLDARCIEHTLKTRVENFDRIIKEMDKHNKQLESDAIADGRRELSNQLDRAASTVL